MISPENIQKFCAYLSRILHGVLGCKPRTEAAAILDSGLELGVLNFVAAKGNGFACSDCSGDDIPHPILFFVAAKENGFACLRPLECIDF